jgi:hypothetical protein
MAPKKPRVSPKVDLKGYVDGLNAKIVSQVDSGADFDSIDVSRDFAADRRDLGKKYDQAAQQAPAPPAPPETGLGGVNFYPAEVVGFDGVVDPGAVIGRVTPLEMMRQYYGPERARENAVNLWTRNKSANNEGGLFPNMDPRGFEAHFNKPIHIIRGSLAGESNGAYTPDLGLGIWQRADDGFTGMVEHELAGHAPTNHSGYRDGTLGSKLANEPDEWSGPDDEIKKMFFAALLDRNISKLDPNGSRKSTPFGSNYNRAISGDQADQLYEQGLTGYHFRPQEMLANTLNWKNQALQVFGAQLPGTKPKEIDLAKALLSSDPGVRPKFQAGPRAGMDADGFNFLHAQQRSIFEYLMSVDPAKAKKYLDLIYRLGATGGVAALPSLLDDSEPNQ